MTDREDQLALRGACPLQCVLYLSDFVAHFKGLPSTFWPFRQYHMIVLCPLNPPEQCSVNLNKIHYTTQINKTIVKA